MLNFKRAVFTWSAITALSVISAFAWASWAAENSVVYSSQLSPVTADLRLSIDDARLIEPTSPVLGKDLTASIKADTRTPDEILQALQSQYPELKHDVLVSILAYIETMKPGLDAFCNAQKTTSVVASHHGFKEIETGAIPVEILVSFHDEYVKNLIDLRARPSIDDVVLQAQASELARAYQDAKYNCPSVLHLKKMEKEGENFLPRRWVKLLELHDRVSSPESPYPRVQFSINGFSQYVYNSLFDIPLDRLRILLKTAYNAEAAWIQERRTGKVPALRFTTAIEEKLFAEGFSPREILLFLSYSTRNMPSLDIQYAREPERALLLEVYFWKFRNNRNEVQAKYYQNYFPNVVMSANLGIYHFMTAALVSCEARLAGFSKVLSNKMALVDQGAYKVDKLFGAVKLKTIFRIGGIKKLKATAKEQGFWPGVQAGQYGGRHGTDFCSPTPSIDDDQNLDDAPSDAEGLEE